jgi:hypothetical protein
MPTPARRPLLCTALLCGALQVVGCSKPSDDQEQQPSSETASQAAVEAVGEMDLATNTANVEQASISEDRSYLVLSAFRRGNTEPRFPQSITLWGTWSSHDATWTREHDLPWENRADAIYVDLKGVRSAPGAYRIKVIWDNGDWSLSGEESSLEAMAAHIEILEATERH